MECTPRQQKSDEHPTGQNKNNYVMWYYSWRTIHRLHLNLSHDFLEAGHFYKICTVLFWENNVFLKHLCRLSLKLQRQLNLHRKQVSTLQSYVGCTMVQSMLLFMTGQHICLPFSGRFQISRNTTTLGFHQAILEKFF